MARVKVPFRERYRTSRLIFRQSLQMMRRERDLWWFPAVATVVMLAVIVPLGWLGFMAGTQWLGPAFLDLPAWAMPFLFLLLLPVMYPFMVLAGLLNAALQFAAHERMNGRPCTKRQAWRRALSCLGPIARFNLIAMLVTGILGVVGQLLDKLRIVPWLGQAVQAAGTFAWAVAAYFVIPVIVVERERSAIAALRASTALARSQWGKATAGIVTVGLFVLVPFLLLMVPAILAMLVVPLGLAAGWIPPDAFFTVMMVVLWSSLGLLMLGLMAVMLLSGMVGALYQVGLYAFARTGKVLAPYSTQTLADAWAPYRQG